MSNQRENRLFASVRGGDDPAVIAARTAGVLSLVRTGVGNYTVTLVDGIAASEETHAVCSSGVPKEDAPPDPTRVSVEKISATVYDVSVSGPGAVATDALFSLTIWRCAP